MKKEKLSGMIFDMDGVLCDSEPFICEAACKMFEERYNTHVKPEDFLPFVGAGENRYIGGVAEKYGITVDIESDKARTYAIYLEIIKGCLKPLPGTIDFINRCRQKGLKTAVATSADAVKLEGNLVEIGLPKDSFDACVTGSEVEHKKPAPDIFLKAVEKTGLVPETCCVFEDAPNGITAAKKAGCMCVGITSSFDKTVLINAGADETAGDLSQVAWV